MPRFPVVRMILTSGRTRLRAAYRITGLLLPALAVVGSLSFPPSVRAEVSGTISTYAGGGSGGTGDGVPATTAQLRLPRELVADGKGGLYIVETGQHRIRRVGPDGILTTVAGMGGRGYSGDGGPATEALLESPNAIALDRHGSLFIADTGNHCIRKVDSQGIITTVAGDGRGGYSGDGGPATQARLYAPKGVAVDGSDNLYVSDTGNSCVRKVTPDGIIHPFAGKQGIGYGGDGGPALDATLFSPHGLAVDIRGGLYIADFGNYRVRRVNRLGIINTVAGTGEEGDRGDGGPATSALFGQPVALAADRVGSLYIADEIASRVRRVDPQGVITTVAGNGIGGSSGDGGPADRAGISWPAGLALDTDGNLYLSDNCYSKVRKVSNIAAPGVSAGEETAPTLPGDANGDGALNVSDVKRILRSLVGLEALSLREQVNADLDDDLRVDVRDAVLLLKELTSGGH